MALYFQANARVKEEREEGRVASLKCEVLTRHRGWMQSVSVSAPALAHPFGVEVSS